MATAVPHYSDDDLLPQTEYHYNVVATNNIGEDPIKPPDRADALRRCKPERVPAVHFRNIQAR